jgi:hypothetical protein
MKIEPKGQVKTNKAYCKPSWEKQEIFERFTATCQGSGSKAASPCQAGKILT